MLVSHRAVLGDHMQVIIDLVDGTVPRFIRNYLFDNQPHLLRQHNPVVRNVELHGDREKIFCCL